MLRGPTSAKNPILLTLVILASITSPLNCGELREVRTGLSTMAWYLLRNSARPVPGIILPCPTSKIDTTLMI